MVNELQFSSNGYRNFNKQGTEDWLMAVIPNEYQRNTEYVPDYTYREQMNSNPTRNMFLAFISWFYMTKVDINRITNIANKG